MDKCINNLNGEEIVGTFYKNKLQITIQKKFRIDKLIMKIDNKIYAKWKCYYNSFNSQIYKKKTHNK